uniref:Uncharacterized protein n=1 Tax=Anguilla anguilla TaxID=7936 RepID=A0A0E9U6E9_ANGAN
MPQINIKTQFVFPLTVTSCNFLMFLVEQWNKPVSQRPQNEKTCLAVA